MKLRTKSRLVLSAPLLALAASSVYAQNVTLIALNPNAAPTASVIVLTGAGFTPGMAVPPVTVTLAPQAGGPSLMVTGTVQGSGAGRAINFQVPVGPTGVYNVSISRPGLTSINSLPFNLVGSTSPRILSVTPSAASQGQSLSITIVGSGTAFTAASTVGLGLGIGVLNVAFNSATSLTASVVVDPSATPGLRDVTVTTGGSTLTGTGLFAVTGAPRIASVSPSVGQQGQSLSVAVVGQNTSFTGASVASFGPGIVVESVVANSSSLLTVGIRVLPMAALGTRNVSVTTGTETLTGMGIFTVTSAQTPQIVAVSPPSGQQGRSFGVTITGQATNFSTASVVDFGQGITVSAITVGGPTSIIVAINISSQAPAGPRDVTVTTAGAAVTGLGLFNVTSGQQTGALLCSVVSAVPPLLRAEGFTELIGDIAISCTGGTDGRLQMVNLQLFLNVPVTSRLTDGQSDALLTVNGVSYHAVPSQNGSSIVWPNVQVAEPGAGSPLMLRVTNVRANATAIADSAGLVPRQVIAFLSVSPANSLPLTSPQQVVGYVVPGLSFDVTDCAGASAASPSFVQCEGQDSLPNPARNMQFALRFREGFASAFKTRSQEGPAADHSTRLAARFLDIPPGVRLFVTSGPLAAGSAALNAQLTQAEAAFSLFCPLSGGAPVPAVELQVIDGSAIAIWEVTAADSASLETALFGVAVAYDPVPASQFPGLGQASVSGRFAPFYAGTGEAGRMSSALPIPRFLDAPQSATAFRIDACVTNLLFPFVTNRQGFDTGIAVSNTASQSGPCTVNYYGSSPSGAPAPPPQRTSVPVQPGSILTFVLSSGGSHGIPATPGFQGYLIFQCDFRFAHGFAFLTDGPIGIAGVAEGYLALVMDSNSAPARGSMSESLSH